MSDLETVAEGDVASVAVPTAPADGAGGLNTRTCKSLMLLIDASNSVTGTENMATQYKATAAALISPRIMDAIFANDGTIALKAVKFDNYPQDITEWHAVTNKDELETFAAEVNAGGSKPTGGYGNTHIGNALDYSVKEFKDSPCQSDKRVIDISTDGEQNGGMPIQGPRSAAIDAGITINGIGVHSSSSTLAQTMRALRRDVITPTGFAVEANWERYPDVLEHKMYMEIAEVPPAEQLTPEATPVVRKAEINSGITSTGSKSHGG